MIKSLEDLLSKDLSITKYYNCGDYFSLIVGDEEAYLKLKVKIEDNDLGDIESLINEITERIYIETKFKFNMFFTMKKDNKYIMIKNNKVSIAIKGEFLVNYTYKIFFGDMDITERWV